MCKVLKELVRLGAGRILQVWREVGPVQAQGLQQAETTECKHRSQGNLKHA